MLHEEDEYGPDDDADAEDREAPDAADRDDEDSGGANTVPCPFCRRDLFEGADVCPHCGNFVSAADAPRRGPGWVAAGVVVCLVVVLIWVVTSHG